MSPGRIAARLRESSLAETGTTEEKHPYLEMSGRTSMTGLASLPSPDKDTPGPH